MFRYPGMQCILIYPEVAGRLRDGVIGLDGQFDCSLFTFCTIRLPLRLAHGIDHLCHKFPLLQDVQYSVATSKKLWSGRPSILIAADPAVERPGIPALANKALAEVSGIRYAMIPGAGHML
jgi:hypothetical protein